MLFNSAVSNIFVKELEGVFVRLSQGSIAQQFVRFGFVHEPLSFMVDDNCTRVIAMDGIRIISELVAECCFNVISVKHIRAVSLRHF